MPEGARDASVDLSAVADLASPRLDDLAPVPPVDGAVARVTICHDPMSPTIVDVPASEVAAHVAHGDPIGVPSALLFVDANAAAVGLGTQSAPFRRVTDALALMRCRTRATGETGDIRLAAGVHTVSYDAALLAANPTYEPGPIIVDFPVRLRGATQVALDSDGHPRPDYSLYGASNATFVVAQAPLGPEDSQSLIFVADTTDVTVEGLVLSSGHCRVASLCPGRPTVMTRGGVALQTVRANRVTLRGNVIQPGFQSGVDTRGSSVSLRTTYASDTAICVACISGPGTVEVVANRLDNGLGGVFAAPTLGNTPFSLGTQASAFTIPPFTAAAAPTLDLTVDDNVLSGHTRNVTAFGVRLAVYGRDTTAAVTRQVMTARVRNNRVAADNGGVGASQGLIVDSGFSDRLATGVLAGTLFVVATGNTFTVSGAKISAMTMRQQPLLNASNLGQWKTFAPLDRGTLVIDSDLTYPTGFRVDLFAVDPLADKTLSGTACTTDADCSSATYRGQALPGSCNASKLCECLPGLTDVGGTCTDASPPANVVVINGAVIAPGTTVP